LTGLKGGDLYLLATLLASTGLRRGEVLGLAWRHIDQEAGTLTVERSVEQTKAGSAFKEPKNESSARTITLPENVTAFLRAEWKRQAEALLKVGKRVASEHLLFQPDPFDPARPFGPDWISLKFSRAAKKLGFEVGLHSLRHSHASQLLAAGVPATAVASRLGHSSVRTTLSVYAHAVEEAERRAGDAAAAIMRDVLGSEG
jgi:integrase